MMDALAFAYWLQGFVELTGGQQPTPEQWKMIQEHLQTVFKKVTPPLESGSLTGLLQGWPTATFC